METHHAHVSAEQHHHHSHAKASRHDGGHHLLQVSNLSVGFRMYDPDAPFFTAEQRMNYVIDDLSISVHAGEVVAVVGSSGSGKTILADCVMGLFEPNAEVHGEIWLDGQLMDSESLANARGRTVSLVPQGVAHLDPLMRVGKQMEERVGETMLNCHSEAFPCCHSERKRRISSVPTLGDSSASGLRMTTEAGRRMTPLAIKTRLLAETRADRKARRKELFARYGLDEEVARLYPHELSGGMARRILLCCALMDDPKLIIADEPTPGLDLDLAVTALSDFRAFADDGGGVMLITHDIELALRVADRVAVFKDGTVVEETAVESFASPDLLAHPFSRALWHALPEHEFATGVAEADGLPGSREARLNCHSEHKRRISSAPSRGDSSAFGLRMTNDQ